MERSIPVSKRQNKGGLKPTPVDDRDFQLGAVVTLPKLEDLPTHFRLPYTVKNQMSSDFCSAYMSCAMSEVQEGIELEPSYSFAKSKELSGDVDSWGQDLRYALKCHLEGALASEDSPYNLSNQTPNFLRNIANWKISKLLTSPYRKKTFFKITGQYDHFDNIRASIHKFQSPVGTGVDFSWPLTQIILDTIGKGFGHAMPIIGWKPNHLIYGNSYGIEAGDNGVHYVSREVVNHFVEKYNAYMFTDISPDDAKYALETGTKIGDNWLIAFIKAFLNLFR